MTIDKAAALDVDARLMNVVLKNLEESNKLPAGYLTGLRTADSDWDFIVKIGLILEALVARAVESETGPRSTYKKGRRESHHDRLELAKSKGVIDRSEFEMLASLAMLRNAFVHRLENLTRALSDYFSELSPARQKRIAKSILAAGIPGRLGQDKDNSAITNFPGDFRKTVLAAIFPTLLKLGYGGELKKKEKRYTEWRGRARTAIRTSTSSALRWLPRRPADGAGLGLRQGSKNASMTWRLWLPALHRRAAQLMGVAAP